MPADTTQTLQRAIALLDSFNLNRPSLGVREAARIVGLSSSTTGRLLASLRELGVLDQNPETKAYSLGGKVLTWSNVYTNTLDVRNLAMAALEKIHEETQETISLYVMEGDERVCVERLESPQNVRIVARIGRRLPLYAGSAGKVFLAFLSEERRNEILSHTNFKPFTPQTIVNREKLLEELEQIKSQGFAISRGEWTPDASGVAAPIFNSSRDIIGAITISGPSQRFTDEKIEKYSRDILAISSQISRAMGYFGRIG